MLLQAPFSPMTAWTSPAAKSRSMPLQANTPPKLMPSPQSPKGERAGKRPSDDFDTIFWI